jgi:hypothetical protein
MIQQISSKMVTENKLRKMKFILAFFLTVFTTTVYSQRFDSLEIPSNSFESSYRKTNPNLMYKYDDISQTHNYSNNWDFDKDGINDELYFIGTGGAHLYYYLKVILSTDKLPREFDFIQSDFPFLTATDTLNMNKTPLGFVVADLETDMKPTVIVRLDDKTYQVNKNKLTKLRIKTRNIAISFENGKSNYQSLK